MECAASMKTLHLSEREIITQQQQILHVRSQIDLVKRRCQHERIHLQQAKDDMVRAELMRRRCIRQTAKLCDQITVTKVGTHMRQIG